MTIYETLMVIISSIRLVVDAVKLHKDKEHKNSRPDPDKD